MSRLCFWATEQVRIWLGFATATGLSRPPRSAAERLTEAGEPRSLFVDSVAQVRRCGAVRLRP